MAAPGGPGQPLEWKFSQVFGERAAGEEVQEGTLAFSCLALVPVAHHPSPVSHLSFAALSSVLIVHLTRLRAGSVFATSSDCFTGSLYDFEASACPA